MSAMQDETAQANADRIRVGDRWYVAANAARVDVSPHVLKHDESFLVADRNADVDGTGLGEEGLYHEDTRYLSECMLTIDGVRPMFLGSSVKDDNSVLVAEFMNPDLQRTGVEKGTLHIFRAKLLWQHCCHEHVRIANHGSEPARFELALRFAADFVDLFEVRGMRRARSGRRLPAVVREAEVVFAYDGLDGVARRTRLDFQPRPDLLDDGRASWDLELAPGAECHVYCGIYCERGEAGPPPRRLDYDQAYLANAEERRASQDAICSIVTSNPQVNAWLRRSASDLAMLSTRLPTGAYPYAGVPWYSTTFGRDGILTARELLWSDPEPARGVLRFLAQTQARIADPSRDAEPGKILHEARKRRDGSAPARCRSAATTAASTRRRCSSLLAGAYWKRTGDLALVVELWPHLLAALGWIDDYGDGRATAS